MKDEQTQFALHVHQKIKLVLNIEDAAKVCLTTDREGREHAEESRCKETPPREAREEEGGTGHAEQTEPRAAHGEEPTNPSRCTGAERCSEKIATSKTFISTKASQQPCSWARRRDGCERCSWQRRRHVTVSDADTERKTTRTEKAQQEERDQEALGRVERAKLEFLEKAEEASESSEELGGVGRSSGLGQPKLLNDDPKG